MKIPGIVKAAGFAVVIVFLVVIVLSGMISAGVWSSFATGDEKMAAAATPIGKAMVVYDPGVTGTAKDTASKIAGDLLARGYEVDLAGIKSAAAANVSSYDVIVVGGPVYGGRASTPVQSYLGALAPPDNARVGAFAIGMFNYELKQPFPAGVALDESMVLQQGNNVDAKCADFVAALLQ